MTSFFIDRHIQVQAHVQLKRQIKFACTCRDLVPGDVLPSIRALARQLGIGDGVVRRAYRELREVGLLATENRKHVVVTPGSTAAAKADALVRACVDHCRGMIAWAEKERLSSVALARLLLQHALAREAASPAYVFVDICRLAAQESAEKIARSWEVKVAGFSLREFAALSGAELGRLTAVMVNEHLYEDVKRVFGETTQPVFPVRMRVDKRLERRIDRVPARSHVLIVTSDSSASPGDRAFVRHCLHVLGGRRRFDAKALSELPNLTTLARARRYPLVLVCPVAWEQIPTKVKRMAAVVRVATEPDPRSLEETRIAAGVLL